MSLTKRLIDLARSNLNLLLERAADRADPRRKLADIPDAELEAELNRRRSARQVESEVTAARAKVDGKVPPRMPRDRAERERIAREREARVRAERAARERETTRPPPGWRPGPGPRPSAGPGPSPGAGSARPGTGRRDPDLARYYERLEIAYGSDFNAVKTSYRRLMRKYHPDLHVGKSPEKQRAATEVSQALTQAYNELEKVLLGGPNRR